MCAVSSSVIEMLFVLSNYSFFNFRRTFRFYFLFTVDYSIVKSVPRRGPPSPDTSSLRPSCTVCMLLGRLLYTSSADKSIWVVTTRILQRLSVLTLTRTILRLSLGIRYRLKVYPTNEYLSVELIFWTSLVSR